MAQVFSNLLNNASKFSPREGEILLSVERRVDDAVAVVKDHGIGIPPENLGRIFEMFVQGDDTSSHGGLGVGLALARRLVGLHGGRLEAASAGRGQGSAFTVRLPLFSPRSDTQAPEREGGDAHGGSIHGRIMVVDDNEDAAQSLSVLLTAKGGEVLTCHDGLEAVSRAAAFRPDVILMDIGMPKLDGCAAARKIRAEPWGAGIVLVALTGWGQDQDRRETTAAGFDHHLVKPVDPRLLAPLLERLRAGRP